MEHKYGLYKLWSNYEVIKYTYAPLMKDISESEERIKMILDNIQKKIIQAILLYYIMMK